MSFGQGQAFRGVLLAAAGMCAVFALGGTARAATPTQTILTGGVLRYQGSATADLNASSDGDTQVDHAQGTFDESWLVSPYQVAGLYRNSLSWSPPGSASEHTRIVSGDGTVEDDFTCQYGLAHAGGNGTAGVDRTAHTLTAWGLQGAIVDQPNADCTDHGIRQNDGRELLTKLWVGTGAKMTLPADPPVADTQSLPVSQSGTDPNGYQTTAHGTVTLSCALCVTEIDFRQPDLPGGDMEDVPDTGTYDGNEIEIDVKVENRSSVDLTVPATLQVKDGPTLSSDQLTAPAGSTTTVIFKKISTQGYAWKDGAAQSKRTIQYLTPFGGGQRDLPVRPKPLILVHGLNSSADTWSGYHDFATALHPNWDTFAVGDGQVPGTMDTDGSTGRSIADNALTEAQYIAGVRDKTDASHVDLVVHSMGGLISRQYIQANMPNSYDGKPVASHLVMLGTPNEGSPCADLAAMLPNAGTPYLQLRPDWVKNVFDATVTNTRGVPFSIVAGNPLSFTCLNDDDPGDGVVEVPSAWYEYLDHALTDLIHTRMTGSETLFDTFVKPHLAVGIPTGARATAVALAGVAQDTSSAADPPQQVAERQQLTLGPGETGEIPVTVASGDSGVAFVFAAPDSVSADLVDPSGTVTAHEDAGSPEAGMPIRVLRADAPAPGTWRLRLTQTGTGTAAASAVAALDGDPLRLVASATQDGGGGPVSISATLTNAGAGVPGATVTAVVTGEDGSSVPVTLTDAGQGTYRGATGALAAGYHLVVVQAQDAGATRTTSTAALPATTSPPAGGGTTTPPSGGGTTTPPSGGGTPPGGTTTPPRLVLLAGGHTRQSLRKGVLEVTCASKSGGTCRAQATVTIGHHRYRSGRAKATASARPHTLVLRFAKKALAKIRRAVRHGHVKAKVAMTLTGPTGGTARATVVIRLRA